MSYRSVPAPLCACALSVLLAACASHPTSVSVPAASMPAAAAPAPGKHPNRFEMTRDGKRMTADDFDAWMQARGIRIAGGKAEGRQMKPVRRPATPKSGASGRRGTAQR